MSSWSAVHELFADISSEELQAAAPEVETGRTSRYSKHPFEFPASEQADAIPQQKRLPFGDSTLAGKPLPSPSVTQAREIARVIIRKIPQEMWDGLFEERANLLDKVEQEGLSKKEHARLRYVEWQLDNLEDATVGPGLDDMETIVNAYEELAQEIQRYATEVSRTKNRSRGSSGRRRRRG